MGKKTAAVLVLMGAAAAAFGGYYVKQNNNFEPYPEAEYLTEEEAQKRPLYGELTKDEQAVYTALYRGICRREEQIPLPFDVDGDMYTKVYCMLEKQEPALFYLDSRYYIAREIKTAQIEFREDSEAVISSKVNELEMTAEKIIAGIPAGADEFEKTLYIHDYIAENCQYAVKSESGYGAAAYGCLVEKTANCEGYAKAFLYLAERAGIDSVLVTGTVDSGENHAWNKAEIDGKWYNLDVTWDDTEDQQEKRHVYFLCNDADFSKSHFSSGVYGDELECVSEGSDYYRRMDLFVKDMNDADRIVRREVSLGTDFLEIKFSDSEIYEDFKAEFFEEGRIFDVIEEFGNTGAGEKITVNMRENEQENCITLYMDGGF